MSSWPWFTPDDIERAVLKALEKRENRPPFGDAEVERLARWMYERGQPTMFYEPWSGIDPARMTIYRHHARTHLAAAFGVEGDGTKE